MRLNFDLLLRLYLPRHSTMKNIQYSTPGAIFKRVSEKEAGLVLVSRNSAVITFMTSPLQKLV